MKCTICNKRGAMKNLTYCLYCHRESIWVNKTQPAFLSALPERIAKQIMQFSFGTLDKVGSSYLYGPIRTGKTLMACAMMMAYAHKKHHANEAASFAFVETPILLQRLKNTYNKDATETEQSILEQYQNTDILVLDDIGVQKTSDWAYAILYMIINHRYNNYKTTIFTSNCSLEELADQMQDDRITRRIVDMSDAVVEMSR